MGPEGRDVQPRPARRVAQGDELRLQPASQQLVPEVEGGDLGASAVVGRDDLEEGTGHGVGERSRRDPDGSGCGSTLPRLMAVAPRVAVVVPTFQRAATVQRAVASVLAQEGPPFEVIVVDDGSTDDTADRLAAVADPRLQVLRQRNQGRGAARNAGAAAARAPVLTFLDSDDEALPGWLAEIERLVDLDRRPVVRLPILVAGPDGRPVRRPAGALDPRRPFPRGASQPGSFAVAASLFEAVGGYDPALAFSENTDLLVRLALAAGRSGWTAAVGDHAGVLLHAEQASTRTTRYGSAPRQAAEVLLDRYPTLLHDDRRTRQDYLAIIGVDDLRRGRRGAAARTFLRSWAARPGSVRAAGRLLGVAVPPRLRALRSG